ncbi:MAG: hypothetical protein C5B56_05380 [Proteobacteria bacterium]|nr:MAG: hypothetical protein C5B56_05380 [Pseudomonadota bacterium]
MGRPPDLPWLESSPTSIHLPKEVWHSGAASDVLEVGGDRLLVGTKTGGLWLAEPNGNALPLSFDWEFPDVLCLAQRTSPPRQFFCGTAGSLFHHIVTDPDPLTDWRPLNLPPDVTQVNRIVLQNSNLIIATDNGIWWAQFVSGDVVAWQQALMHGAFHLLIPLKGAWSGLARTGDRQIVAGTLIQGEAAPILFGEFGADGLVFSAPTLDTELDDREAMNRISIGSCDSAPARAYAVAFHDKATELDGKLTNPFSRFFRLFRSNNGGRSWKALSPFVSGAGVADSGMDRWIGGFEAGGPIKNLSVHPTLKDRLVLCGLHVLVSDEGGSDNPTFTPMGLSVVNGKPTFPAHMHDDSHTLRFAPDAASPNRVFIATDGGVFRAGDWTDPASFTSLHNKGLRTLQFLDPFGIWDFQGGLGSTLAPTGIVAGGLQDNGDVWKANHTKGTWQKSQGGDGGFNVLVGQHRYLHQVVDQMESSQDGTVYSQTLLSDGNLGPQQTVPLVNDAGEQLANKVDTAIEPVQQPTFRNGAGQLLYAVGWKKTRLYGIFADDNGDSPSCMKLADAPDPITTVASYDGFEVLYATTANQIFSMNPGSGESTLMKVNGVPVPPPPALPPIPTRILCTAPGQGLAAFSDPTGAPPPIVRRNGSHWDRTASSPVDPHAPRGSFIYGMDADDTDPDGLPLIMVSTESRVWASSDKGDSWKNVSAGLPVQPHCSDLRFNRFKRTWQLGTWGRSMWQAGRRVQVGVSSLIQSDYTHRHGHGNFEALVLIGEDLFHYYRNNTPGPINRWQRSVKIGGVVTAPACLIQSDWQQGAENKNFEALVLEGQDLWHWVRRNDSDMRWERQEQIGQTIDGTFHPLAVTGAASMIQGDYGTNADHGNFEALIPTADGLWHWAFDVDQGEWVPVAQVTSTPGAVGCITTSDYTTQGHFGLEALVFEPSNPVTGRITHYYWDLPARAWRPTAAFADNALGPACLIQSDFQKSADNRNLEAILWVQENGVPVLRHWFRRDDDGSLEWHRDDDTGIVSRSALGPASMVQSSYLSADHGNFETIFVDTGNDVWHSYREQSSYTWTADATVT